MVGLLVVVAAAIAGAAPAAGAAQDDAAHPQYCAAEEYHFLDYLIGDWDVVDTKTGQHLVFNKVEPINDGCAVRESLTMQGDIHGMSITFFSAQDRRWFSYHHSPNVHAELEGSTSADGINEMLTHTILPGSSEPQELKQVTDRDAAGRPHQSGYAKTSSGEWKQIWDVTFCPRSSSPTPLPPCGAASKLSDPH